MFNYLLYHEIRSITMQKQRKNFRKTIFFFVTGNPNSWCPVPIQAAHDSISKVFPANKSIFVILNNLQIYKLYYPSYINKNNLHKNHFPWVFARLHRLFFYGRIGLWNSKAPSGSRKSHKLFRKNSLLPGAHSPDTASNVLRSKRQERNGTKW